PDRSPIGDPHAMLFKFAGIAALEAVAAIGFADRLRTGPDGIVEIGFDEAEFTGAFGGAHEKASSAPNVARTRARVAVQIVSPAPARDTNSFLPPFASRMGEEGSLIFGRRHRAELADV